jgi:hypothetical protein
MYHPKLQPTSLMRNLEVITIFQISSITNMTMFLAKVSMSLLDALMNGERGVLLFFPVLYLTWKSTNRLKKKKTRLGGKLEILVPEDGAVLNNEKLKRMMENTTAVTVWNLNFLILENVQGVFPSSCIETMLSSRAIDILSAMTRELGIKCNLDRKMMIHCLKMVQNLGLLLFFAIYPKNLLPLSSPIC